MGFEYLSDSFDFRANGYVPFGKREEFLKVVNPVRPRSSLAMIFQRWVPLCFSKPSQAGTPKRAFPCRSSIGCAVTQRLLPDIQG